MVKEANMNLGMFIRDCLTHLDRGFVFEIVNYIKDQFNPPDTQVCISLYCLYYLYCLSMDYHGSSTEFISFSS